MQRRESDPNQIRIQAIEIGSGRNGYAPVQIMTDEGEVEGRLYRAAGSHRGAIWVGGAGGGWDTPARELYPRLCRALVAEGITSLRVRFRDPTRLEQSVRDVLAGAAFLRQEGIDMVALTGHSFGGAVVIQAAAVTAGARAVVALATQSLGADPVSRLGPHCAILLLHGTADQVLPAFASLYVYHLALEPKRLRLFEGAGHGLDEVAEEVYEDVRGWLLQWLEAGGR